jgi:hypothetical protein
LTAEERCYKYGNEITGERRFAQYYYPSLDCSEKAHRCRGELTAAISGAHPGPSRPFFIVGYAVKGTTYEQGNDWR